jgi:hypothetical protein
MGTDGDIKRVVKPMSGGERSGLYQRRGGNASINGEFAGDPIDPDIKICVDGISVGVIHRFFVDAAGRVWDPASNTWGQKFDDYAKRVTTPLKDASCF